MIQSLQSVSSYNLLKGMFICCPLHVRCYSRFTDYLGKLNKDLSTPGELLLQWSRAGKHLVSCGYCGLTIQPDLFGWEHHIPSQTRCGKEALAVTKPLLMGPDVLLQGSVML